MRRRASEGFILISVLSVMTLVAALVGALSMSVPVSDAISALENLGYAPAQASAAVAAALRQAGEAAQTKDLIRLGLLELAR